MDLPSKRVFAVPELLEAVLTCLVPNVQDAALVCRRWHLCVRNLIGHRLRLEAISLILEPQLSEHPLLWRLRRHLLRVGVACELLVVTCAKISLCVQFERLCFPRAVELFSASYNRIAALPNQFHVKRFCMLSEPLNVSAEMSLRYNGCHRQVHCVRIFGRLCQLVLDHENPAARVQDWVDAELCENFKPHVYDTFFKRTDFDFSRLYRQTCWHTGPDAVALCEKSFHDQRKAEQRLRDRNRRQIARDILLAFVTCALVSLLIFLYAHRE